MSLLNHTAATPGRVLALLRLINQLGSDSPVTLEQATAWLAPKGVQTRDGTEKARPAEGMSHTVAFACELGLMNGPPDGPWTTDEEWSDAVRLADVVHERLTGLAVQDENSTVLAAYAAVIMKAELAGHVGWACRLDKKSVADELNDNIRSWRESPKENPLSGPKLVTWEDWLAALGLLMPAALMLPYAPYPLPRIRREIRSLASKKKPKLPVSDFWNELVRRTPYLDDGNLWNSLRSTLGLPPFSGTLSLVSSSALLQLHEERVIDLEFVPDARGAFRVIGSPKAVSAVTLLRPAVR